MASERRWRWSTTYRKHNRGRFSCFDIKCRCTTNKKFTERIRRAEKVRHNRSSKYFEHIYTNRHNIKTKFVMGSRRHRLIRFSFVIQQVTTYNTTPNFGGPNATVITTTNVEKDLASSYTTRSSVWNRAVFRSSKPYQSLYIEYHTCNYTYFSIPTYSASTPLTPEKTWLWRRPIASYDENANTRSDFS